MNIALITARGGSKGLPGKNIYPLAGKPLIAWTIEAAQQSGGFDNVVVSTDCENISNVAKEYGAKVIHRPSELATDTASSHVVIEHAIQYLGLANEDKVVLLQPTSPMRTAKDIVDALQVMDRNSDCHCVISVYEPANTPAKAYKMTASGEIAGLVSAEAPYTRRQDLPRCFQPNGAIYAFRVEHFNEGNCIPKSSVYPFIMEESRSLDVDTLDDLLKIQSFFESNEA